MLSKYLPRSRERAQAGCELRLLIAPGESWDATHARFDFPSWRPAARCCGDVWVHGIRTMDLAALQIDCPGSLRTGYVPEVSASLKRCLFESCFAGERHIHKACMAAETGRWEEFVTAEPDVRVEGCIGEPGIVNKGSSTEVGMPFEDCRLKECEIAPEMSE